MVVVVRRIAAETVAAKMMFDPICFCHKSSLLLAIVHDPSPLLCTQKHLTELLPAQANPSSGVCVSSITSSFPF